MTTFQDKPFSPACERNKDPILQVLKEVIPDENRSLLEIGSGTGQHAAYFAPRFPRLQWTTSDLSSRHEGIRMWMSEAACPNLHGPLELEIGKQEIPAGRFDFVFSANVLHIVSAHHVEKLVDMLGKGLATGSQVLFYGPFNYHGRFTSESNELFDRQLKRQDPSSGIRDFEEICRLMREAGFELVKDHAMPSNNRTLHFRKIS